MTHASCLRYSSCVLIGYCVNRLTLTFIVVMCVIKWKTAQSERQPRVGIEVDLKASGMSVTDNKLSS